MTIHRDISATRDIIEVKMGLFGDCLKSWQLDNDWLDEAKKLSVGKDIVTLDIFDTCLTRDVESPIDIFCRIEIELEKCGVPASGFAAIRETAEISARQLAVKTTGNAEITLDDIYTELAKNIEFSHDQIEKAKLCELKIERAALYPIADLLAFSRYLVDTNIPYAFVSDMYLPQNFLESLLKEHGYSSWFKLFVSGVCKRSKAGGDIWADSHFIGKKILHIGDNVYDDGQKPKQIANVDTLLYLRGQSERRRGYKLVPAILPLSQQNRLLTISRRSFPKVREQHDKNVMNDLGESFGAIMLGSFIIWLIERAEKNKIKNLYFLSRDGFLIQKAWNLAYNKSAIQSRYIHISRKTLTLAKGYLKSRADHIDSDTLQFLSSFSRPLTVAEILASVGLNSPAVIHKAKYYFGSLTTIITYKKHELLREFYKSISAELFNLLKIFYENSVSYFAQIGLTSNEGIGVVDLGWHGSLQRNLAQICRTIKNDFSCVGFYYGLFTAASGSRYLAGPMESYLFSEFDPVNSLPLNCQGVDIIEDLHTSPEGSTAGYVKRDETIFPLNEPTEQEKTLYEELIEPFQKGALAALTNLITSGSHKLLNRSDLNKETALASYFQLFLSPTNTELTTLAKISHSPSFDHRMCSISDFKRNRRIPDGVGWRVGAMRYAIMHSTGKERAENIEMATNNCNFLSERQLMIFSHE